MEGSDHFSLRNYLKLLATVPAEQAARYSAGNGTARFAGLKHDRRDLRQHQQADCDKGHLKDFATERLSLR